MGGTTAAERHCSGSCPAWMACVAKWGKGGRKPRDPPRSMAALPLPRRRHRRPAPRGPAGAGPRPPPPIGWGGVRRGRGLARHLPLVGAGRGGAGPRSPRPHWLGRGRTAPAPQGGERRSAAVPPARRGALQHLRAARRGGSGVGGGAGAYAPPVWRSTERPRAAVGPREQPFPLEEKRPPGSPATPGLGGRPKGGKAFRQEGGR